MREPTAVGYFLVKPSRRPDWASESLLPAEIISLSTCLCRQFPGDAIDWVQADEARRTEALAAIGIPEERQRAARDWATAEFERAFGWPAVFYSARVARDLRLRFCIDDTVRVIGVAVESKRIDALLAATAPGGPNAGKAGLLEVVERGETLATSVRLGFELLNVGYAAIGCSWLCNGLDRHCSEALGIFPNSRGLLASSEDAERCLAEIERDEVGAEPGAWLPFLLIDVTEDDA